MPAAPQTHRFHIASILPLRANGRGWFRAGELTALSARPTFEAQRFENRLRMLSQVHPPAVARLLALSSDPVGHAAWQNQNR